MKYRHKAYKTELDPTGEQIETLAWWCEISRRVYNWALRGREYHYETTGETLSLYTQDKAFTQFKKLEQYAWLNDAPRRVIYFALRDIDAAFKHFFRRVKQGGNPGYPRIHHRESSFTIYGTDIAVTDKSIRLPKIGWLALKEHDYIPVGAPKYGEVTVSTRAQRWFVSVMVEEPMPKHEAGGPVQAVHPGVRQFLTTRSADGTERRVENRRALEVSQKRLRRLQRKLARQQKGSKNRRKTKDKIARLHYRIACIRRDATQTATTEIVAGLDPKAIIIQTWKIREMLEEVREDLPRFLQRRIRRGIADANMGEMLRQIRYKADWNGTEIIEVDPGAPVSKRCSRCGNIHEEFGMEQMFRCPACGYEVDRETNATKNLLAHLTSD